MARLAGGLAARRRAHSGCQERPGGLILRRRRADRNRPCHRPRATARRQWAVARAYTAIETPRIGATRNQWHEKHGLPLLCEGTLAVWTDGSVTIDIGDGVLRPLQDVIAEYLETRRDAMCDRFVATSLPIDLLATPVPPPG